MFKEHGRYRLFAAHIFGKTARLPDFARRVGFLLAFLLLFKTSDHNGGLLPDVIKSVGS